jgi:uncharacterized protein (UPF0335 family)
VSETSVAADQLKAFIERIERLEEEKSSLSNDIKEVYSEARSAGLDPSVMRKVVARRRKPYSEIQEEEAVLDLYLQALGEQ